MPNAAMDNAKEMRMGGLSSGRFEPIAIQHSFSMNSLKSLTSFFQINGLYHYAEYHVMHRLFFLCSHLHCMIFYP